jgi:hypothetical protein
MGRLKEMGKPVAELSATELRSEQFRCETLINVYGNRVASKGLKKRLISIEKRLSQAVQ